MAEQKTEKVAVQPHEARGTFPDLSDEGVDAMRDVMTAVNGFPYPGDRMDAICSAIAWLQSHPHALAAIFPPGSTTDDAGVMSEKVGDL